MGEVAYILCRFEEKLWRVWELIRKGGWTREEDILSRKCVEKYALQEKRSLLTYILLT